MLNIVQIAIRIGLDINKSKLIKLAIVEKNLDLFLFCVKEKAEMLKKHFFSEKLQADFSDMKETVYSSEMKSLSQISAKNIQNLMTCQQAFSTLKIDDIFNIFLQVMSKLFTEAVTKLTQIC